MYEYGTALAASDQGSPPMGIILCTLKYSLISHSAAVLLLGYSAGWATSVKF